MSYTKAEEQTIRNNKPVTYEKAEELSSQFGKTIRSVISKSVSLKVYKAKPKAEPKPKSLKRDTVRAIEKGYALSEGTLLSLSNMKANELAILWEKIAESTN